MTEPTCALWTMRYGATEVELCADEQEAASLGAGIEERADGTVLGVQHDDGRAVPADEWEAFGEAVQRSRYGRPFVKPSPTRNVRNPFDSGLAQVDEDAPAWLGRQG